MLYNPARITLNDTEYEMHVAKIESTSLGNGDRGIMIVWLHLDYGSSQQGAGGIVLDERTSDDSGNCERAGTAYGLDFIMQVLAVTGADDWERVKGKTIYALKNVGDSWGYVQGIANLYDPERKNFVFEDHKKEFFAKWPEGR